MCQKFSNGEVWAGKLPGSSLGIREVNAELLLKIGGVLGACAMRLLRAHVLGNFCIQLGRLVAILKVLMVSSNDFCGGGEVMSTGDLRGES